MRLAEILAADSRSLAWEECACPQCACSSWTPVLEADDAVSDKRFLLVRCGRCGLVFTNPRPTLDSIDRFYPSDYACHQAKERMRPTTAMQSLLPMHGLARLLDFGCGAGDFLVQMKARGWNVVGLDWADAAIEHARARGVDAHVGTLPNRRWVTECYEAITMRQSLEHVHHPLHVLQAAYRLLTPGGRLIVTVPNFDSLAARWFGPYWYGLDVPRHLTHFTPATLRAMLAEAGFADVALRQERRASWMRHSAERAPHGDMMMRLLRTRLGSSAASWWARAIGRAESQLAIAVK
jgi:2-polyprenyl-3-methyl-5-hydroxy-6-metoxy-1,4-benzoquinol methylase